MIIELDLEGLILCVGVLVWCVGGVVMSGVVWWVRVAFVCGDVWWCLVMCCGVWWCVVMFGGGVCGVCVPLMTFACVVAFVYGGWVGCLWGVCVVCVICVCCGVCIRRMGCVCGVVVIVAIVMLWRLCVLWRLYTEDGLGVCGACMPRMGWAFVAFLCHCVCLCVFVALVCRGWVVRLPRCVGFPTPCLRHSDFCANLC